MKAKLKSDGQSRPEPVVSGERHWWTSPLERLLAQVSQEQLLAFGHLKPLNRACEIICQTYKRSSAALIWGIKEHWEGKSRKNKTWQNHDKKKGRYLWSLVAGRGTRFIKQREPPQISMHSDKYLLEEKLQQCLTQMKVRNSPECELYERRDFLPALARAGKITKNPETTS